MNKILPKEASVPVFTVPFMGKIRILRKQTCFDFVARKKYVLEIWHFLEPILFTVQYSRGKETKYQMQDFEKLVKTMFKTYESQLLHTTKEPYLCRYIYQQ